ncbi:hypothetical protein K7P76_19640 [Cohnella sp. NL03-T5]|nr:hypothetical protein [Cohnella silvisoli]
MDDIRSDKDGLWGNREGSISLEASMVFPWVLMMTFLLLLFSLFISQGAILYYSSSITAERTAFVWSNSGKDALTGAYPQGQYDGLYWRLFDDSLVQGLFGLASGNYSTSIEIRHGMEGSQGSSAEDKLRKIGSQTATVHRLGIGGISYRNIGVKREIEVNMTSVWLAKPLTWLRGEDAATAAVAALVVEPTEFLRSFDLVRYYASKMKAAPGGAAAWRDKAGAILRKRGLK